MNFKVATAGQVLADVVPVNKVLTGGSLRPLAPTNLRGFRDAAGNLTIEWTRRSRLAGGLRPNVGTPISEDDERYQIEILSGSTVVRSHLVASDAGPSTIVQWLPAGTDPANITVSGGTVFFPTGDGQAQSSTPLTDDFRVDFVVNSDSYDSPQYFGLAGDLSAPLATVPPFCFGRTIASSPNPEIQVENQSAVHFTSVAGDVLSIISKGGVVSYYRNYTNSFSSPLYTSPTPATGQAYLPMLFESLGTSKINSVTQQTTRRSSYVYTTGQQSVDFGSVQSSIKVRVYQISAIVGAGNATEGTL